MLRMGSFERRNLRIGLFFVSPWIIGLVLFYLYPIGASLLQFDRLQCAPTSHLHWTG